MNSVTEWFGQLKQGDSLAAQRIYERFVIRLKALARRKLSNRMRVMADEDDVVQAALRSAFSAIAQNRFPQLDDRHDLWQILAMLLDRKIIDAKRREGRRNPLGKPPAIFDPRTRENLSLDRVPAQQPTPEYAAMFAEEVRVRFEQLDDDALRRTAALKLQGYSNEEIAAAFECTVRTVERKLHLIRTIWRG